MTAAEIANRTLSCTWTRLQTHERGAPKLWDNALSSALGRFSDRDEWMRHATAFVEGATAISDNRKAVTMPELRLYLPLLSIALGSS